MNFHLASHPAVGSPMRAANELSRGWSGIVPFTQEKFFPLLVSRWSQTVLVCIFCTVFAACAVVKSIQQREVKPPAAISTQPAETAPLVYYVSVDQLTVYSEPRSSAAQVTQLPLHQKVYRSKIEKGYAYIKAEGTGVTGWVDNARLIWRLPSQQQKASTKTEGRAAEPTPEAPVTKEKAPAPPPPAAEPEPTPTTAEAPIAPQPSSPTPSAPVAPSTPRPIEPSIFNPF